MHRFSPWRQIWIAFQLSLYIPKNSVNCPCTISRRWLISAKTWPEAFSFNINLFACCIQFNLNLNSWTWTNKLCMFWAKEAVGVHNYPLNLELSVVKRQFHYITLHYIYGLHLTYRSFERPFSFRLPYVKRSLNIL